ALPRIADAYADRRTARHRKMLANEGCERGFQFDHLLTRTRPGRSDIARNGQGSGAEMYRCQGCAGGRELIDDGAHAHDVLEMQMGRVVEIDMRLRGVVDDEFESAGELRRDDPRDAAMVQMGLRMLGVFCAR